MTLEIKKKEDLLGLLRESMAELLTTPEGAELVIGAMAGNGDAVRTALGKAGIIVAQPATPSPSDVIREYHQQQDEGRIIRGFGARFRRGLATRRFVDPTTGAERRTYIWGETEVLADAWFRAFLSTDKMDDKDGSPTRGKSLREIGALLNEKASRAPTSGYPLTTETGTGGAFLVPLVVAAEIFEEMNERFVLRNMVEVFTSAAPLQIPRRIAQVQVSRGAPATDINEQNVASLLGAVKLSPERVSVLGYIEPQLALAAAVGPVRWIIGQFAEAMAKDYQRVIVAGDATIREPKGINTLPTSGGNAYDNAKTATWDGTSLQTSRDSIRKLYFKIAQAHRESARFVFIGNNDMIQKLASLNDLNQQPWRDAGPGRPSTYMGKPVVETLALATVTSTSTLLAADMSQYAWLEAPDGLRIEQTREGGQAWTSDTIGIKMVQSLDGAPVIPPAFGVLPSVSV